MLMMAGGLPALTRFWTAMRPPKVVVVGADRHLDGCVGSHGAGDFRIEVRFAVSRVGARIGAIAARLGCVVVTVPDVLAEEGAAISSHVGTVGVAVLHHHDGLSRAREIPTPIERIEIVDGLEIRRHQRIAGTGLRWAVSCTRRSCSRGSI